MTEAVDFKLLQDAGNILADRMKKLSNACDDARNADADDWVYTPHPKEWTPIAEVTNTWKLPSMPGGRPSALLGVFPEIRRAWSAVDNSLFLWSLDKEDDQCLEYNGEKEVICAVGFAKAKPSIFIEAIKYLLIIVTPSELVLVGVCSVGETHPYEEIKLMRLADYTLPADGVTVTTCITCTAKGRIFLAGSNGHIYELLYTSGLGRHRRCWKVCLTSGGLASLVSSWVVPDIFRSGVVDPVIEMIVDNERYILYARTSGMKIQVFDLGENGDGPFNKVAEESNLFAKIADFRGGSIATKLTIVSISHLSPFESRRLHLVAVLSDGKRVYFSTFKNGLKNSFVLRRPHCLEVVATRPPPSLGANFSVAPAVESWNWDPFFRVESSYHSAGLTLISDVSKGSLQILRRDTTPQSFLPEGNGSKSSDYSVLRENVSSLNIEGRILFVADLFSPYCYENVEERSLFYLRRWSIGNTTSQHKLHRRHVILFTTQGIMMDVVLNRPVDILHRLLEQNAEKSVLKNFFSYYGIGEAAAMCLMLSSKIFPHDYKIKNVVSEKAAEALVDPSLGGIPLLKEAEGVYSSLYEGVCIWLSRVLNPVWELTFMVPGVLKNGAIECRHSIKDIKMLEVRIRLMEQYLRTREDIRDELIGLGDESSRATYVDIIDQTMLRNRFPSKGQNNDSNYGDKSSRRKPLPSSYKELVFMEEKALEYSGKLLLRSAEALFLLQVLSNHHLSRFSQDLDPNLRKKLVEMTFHELVCSDKGNSITLLLISEFMKYCVGCYDKRTVHDISKKFNENCHSFYKISDYHFYMDEWLNEVQVCSNEVQTALNNYLNSGSDKSSIILDDRIEKLSASTPASE